MARFRSRTPKRNKRSKVMRQKHKNQRYSYMITMGRKCAVPHCYTGYRKCKEKASLYRVPDDDFFLSKWQEAIAREDRPITPKDYVCEKHFKDDDILRSRIIKDVVEEYQRPRLKPDAIPSVFPELPEFILKMVKKRRKMPVENPNKEEGNSLNTSSGDDKTQYTENSEMKDVKLEPIDTNEIGPVSVSIIENENLNNELDIKSEPEENTVVDSVEDEDDNEKIDPNFGQKMYCCDQCDYKTKYAHNLRTHKTKHLSGEDAYLHCEHCPNYKTKWELTFRNHLKIKHGIGKQEIFKCTMCQFETKVKLCLKRHYDRHNRGIFDKTLLCTFPGCDFKNESKALLNMHIRLHNETDPTGPSTGEKQKSFKCTECLYKTNSKIHIIRHIKSAHNTGDDTIASVNAEQDTALLTLTGYKEVKPNNEAMYKCLKCPYRSRLEENLVKHVFKHKYSNMTAQKELEAKTWKCPKCPYATFFQHALKRHRQVECEKDMYLCPDCNFKSGSKPDYIKHTLVHRNVIMESEPQDEIVAGHTEQLCVGSDLQNEKQYGDVEKADCFNEDAKIKIKVEEDCELNTIQEFVLIKEEKHTDDLE